MTLASIIVGKDQKTVSPFGFEHIEKIILPRFHKQHKLYALKNRCSFEFLNSEDFQIIILKINRIICQKTQYFYAATAKVCKLEASATYR